MRVHEVIGDGAVLLGAVTSLVRLWLSLRDRKAPAEDRITLVVVEALNRDEPR